LARVELITISFCLNPKDSTSKIVTDIKSKAPAIYPITKISPRRMEFPGYLQFGIEFCCNEYTLDCFTYFVLYKLFTLIVFIITFPILLLITLPPFTLFGFPASCKWCRIFGEESVIYSRYFLVPGWNLVKGQPGRELNERELNEREFDGIEFDRRNQNQGTELKS
jgi:hypothetical protein